MANRIGVSRVLAQGGGKLTIPGSRAASRGVFLWAALGALLLASGCSSSESGPAEGNGSLVCPQCQVAGGETSDFGATAAPTPCEQSEVPIPIDEASARALGFGDTLDLFTRSFRTPFAWSPDESLPTDAQPTGYASPTTIRVQTSMGDILHRVPQLAGCDDHLQVTLHVSLSTADGAIAVAGDVTSDAQRGLKNSTFGRLDLNGAHGSLQLFPPAWPNLVGYLTVLLNFFPDAVRGMVGVELVEAGTVVGDDRANYRPIAGRFPIDDCGIQQQPLSATDPSATPAGTALNFDDQINAQLQNPSNGAWSSGGETSVSATLGVPSSLCQGFESMGLSYSSIPLQVVSADGRVNFDGVVHGAATFDATGAPSSVWFESYGFASADSFAQAIGISGVDLSGYPSVGWELDVWPFDPDPTRVGGSLVIEGVRADGTFMVVETLTWH